MLKHYKFNRINESSDNNEDLILKAISVARKHKIRGLSAKYDNKILCNNTIVALRIQSDSISEKYSSVYCIYLVKHNKIIDKPIRISNSYYRPYTVVNDEIKYIDDYIICYNLYSQRTKYIAEYNFLNEDGFTMDEWVTRTATPIDFSGKGIANRCSKHGYHIVTYSGDIFNMINTKGNKMFANDAYKIIWFNEDLIEVDDMQDIRIVDQEGNVKLEGYAAYAPYEYTYLDDNDSSVNVTVYSFKRNVHGTEMDIYTKDMELIVSDCFGIYKQSVGGYLICKYDNSNHWIYNYLGTLEHPIVFDDWVKDFKFLSLDQFVVVTRDDDKENLLDKCHLKPVFDEWYDEISEIFLSENGLSIEYSFAILQNNKCNIFIVSKKHPKHMKFLFDNFVDDIITYKNFILVYDNNQHYIVWGEPLRKDKIDNLYLGYKDRYVWLKINGKFDFIDFICKYGLDTYKTFCERFMDGEMFDACADIKSSYPIVKYNNKYSYIDTLYYEPKFKEGDKVVWFDKVYPVEYDIKIGHIFHVVQDGVEKFLDDLGYEIKK